MKVLKLNSPGACGGPELDPTQRSKDHKLDEELQAETRPDQLLEKKVYKGLTNIP